MTYTLYGAPVSLYTGKARSYLRRQGIDFVERSPGSDRYLNHANQWLAEHPEIQAGTNGQDDPAARGLAGGRGLVGPVR